MDVYSVLCIDKCIHTYMHMYTCVCSQVSAEVSGDDMGASAGRAIHVPSATVKGLEQRFQGLGLPPFERGFCLVHNASTTWKPKSMSFSTESGMSHSPNSWYHP